MIIFGYSVILIDLNDDTIHHGGNYPTKMAAIGKATYSLGSLTDLCTDNSEYVMSTYVDNSSINGTIHLMRKTRDGLAYEKVATAYVLPYYEYKEGEGENE